MAVLEHVGRSIMSGSVEFDNYLQMTDKAIVEQCSSKCQPLSWNVTTMVQFLFSCFLSVSFCSYSDGIVWISSPSDGADALLKSTQLTGSLRSRILTGSYVYPSHLLTQLTTSPTTHFTRYCWLRSHSRVDAFPPWAASAGAPSLSEENQRALTDTSEPQ